MVCNNTKRNITLLIFVVLNTCNIHYVLHNILNSINLKNIMNVLSDTSKSLKTHTCIDVGICKRCVVILAVVFKLSENKVPEFYVSVAFATNLTVGATATVLLTAVIVKL